MELTRKTGNGVVDSFGFLTKRRRHIAHTPFKFSIEFLEGVKKVVCISLIPEMNSIAGMLLK